MEKIKLIKIPISYKIKIEESLKEKIDFICNKIPDIEWSGTLFYTVTGSFKDNNLVIIAQDLFLQDIGNSFTTEFKNTTDLATFMCDNPELLTSNMGLIHSHHTMSTFFSSTDLNTLNLEGNDNNHFVSLIVNNAGNYTAAITRKLYVHQSILETSQYKTFNNVTVTNNDCSYEERDVVIQYFNLEVEYTTPRYHSNSLIERISEIKAEKAKETTAKVIVDKNYSPNNLLLEDNNLFTPTKKAVKKVVEPLQLDPLQYDCTEPIPYGIKSFDFNAVHTIVQQLLTGSVLAGSVKFNVSEYAVKMIDTFNNRFRLMPEFNEFAEWFVEFLLYNSSDPSFAGEDPDVMYAILAFDISNVLKKLPPNAYIEEYINILDNYIL